MQATAPSEHTLASRTGRPHHRIARSRKKLRTFPGDQEESPASSGLSLLLDLEAGPLRDAEHP